MDLLSQFLYRLAFGLAAGMALVPPRWVTSGYYRNHAYVLLGLYVLAALAAWSVPQGLPLWPALAGAGISYVASALWLYELPRAGRVALVLISAAGMAGAWLTTRIPSDAEPATQLLWRIAPATSGLVLGTTLAAMFLGHWYLNTPTMQLAPLKRMVLAMAAAVALQAATCGLGLALELGRSELDGTRWAFVALRWTAGIFGTLALCGMTWQTLKIPNTQAATGMLYVAVITTMLGELSGQLLSRETMYPV